MHLGKVIAEHLTRFIETDGLMHPATCEEIREIEEAEASAYRIIDELVD